eukprot:g32648.t1
MTQLPLHNRNLQPNIALKQAVEAFCETRPGDERRERERQKLQKAVQEAQATEGALKSTYTKEVRETHKLNQMTAAKEGFHNPFLELELEELDRELPVYSAEELGLMNLPYATEQPCFERPRFGCARVMESQGTRRRGGVPQRVTWSQFKASKSAAAKAEIEGRWELLIADGEAKNLLSMRQRLGPSTDPGLVHLREERTLCKIWTSLTKVPKSIHQEIDKMISERAELLEKGSTGSVATSQATASSKIWPYGTEVY